MPKIYTQPEPKNEQQKESQPRKTVGVYDRPVRTGPSRELLIAVAVIVALIIGVLLYGLARGEGLCATSSCTSMLQRPITTVITPG